jgi:hypothetical protein
MADSDIPQLDAAPPGRLPGALGRRGRPGPPAVVRDPASSLALPGLTRAGPGQIRPGSGQVGRASLNFVEMNAQKEKERGWEGARERGSKRERGREKGGWGGERRFARCTALRRRLRPADSARTGNGTARRPYPDAPEQSRPPARGCAFSRRKCRLGPRLLTRDARAAPRVCVRARGRPLLRRALKLRRPGRAEDAGNSMIIISVRHRWGILGGGWGGWLRTCGACRTQRVLCPT